MRARAGAPRARWSASKGPPTIAAIVLETIPGTAGHHDPAAGLPAPASARSVRPHGIMLIADEVMAGFGRAGEWFAIDAHRTADGCPSCRTW